MNIKKVENMAKIMRRKIIDISHYCNLSAHIGGGLSIVDITATLYGAILKYDKNDSVWDGRDRFILSKGHGALGYYTALMAAGIIPEEILDTFQTNVRKLSSVDYFVYQTSDGFWF